MELTIKNKLICLYDKTFGYDFAGLDIPFFCSTIIIKAMQMTAAVTAGQHRKKEREEYYASFI